MTAGASLADRVARDLDTAAWLYEWGIGRAEAEESASAVVAGPLPPADDAPEARLPALPRALRIALGRQAEVEGVTLEAFILYVLTRTAVWGAGPVAGARIREGQHG